MNNQYISIINLKTRTKISDNKSKKRVSTGQYDALQEDAEENDEDQYMDTNMLDVVFVGQEDLI